MGGGWGGVCKVIFMSNPTVVLRLRLGWGFDNKTMQSMRNIDRKEEKRGRGTNVRICGH